MKKLLATTMMMLFALAMSAANAAELEFLKFGEIYLGIDRPIDNMPSINCPLKGDSNKATSNLGAVVNLLGYGAININAKYTHHSCMFNFDRTVYDHAGLEVTYRIW